MAGGDARPRPPAKGGRRQQHQAPSLPLDIVLEIAACSDPVTLVRCAATCWDMRRGIAGDAAFLRRLRLRHATDRFVAPLLRGHLVEKSGHGGKREMYLVDTAAADTTKVRKVTAGFSSAPLASRDGLLLVREGKGLLRVCEPATGRSQILPAEPTFPSPRDRYGYYHRLEYVLLVGDSNEGGAVAAGAVFGQPFQLLLAKMEVSQHRRHLQIQVFSSEQDAWGPFTEIRIPNLYGSRLKQDLGEALVVGGAVHWLCMTDSGSYVIKLHVRSAQVTISELPESFPSTRWGIQHLLVTTSPGGSPMVLVNEMGKVSAWSQSKQTTKWKQLPQPVIDREKVVRFAVATGGIRPSVGSKINLRWFAERSGLVLIGISYSCDFVWLDTQTMQMVRWFSDPLIYGTVCCPYEIGLSSWVPTFSSTTLL